jgi:glycosyltransferase involved in cell wall biosynthesis
VQVLLATYNGERFLREQIESILAQTLPGISILARDDGSQDGTAAILAEYARCLPQRFEVLRMGSSAGGAKANFLALLRASTAAYVAFADQDDVWLPEKLALEMEAMQTLERQHGVEGPLLVFCDLQVVDDRLAPLAPSFWALRNLEPHNIQRLERLLMENVLTGCTALLNAPLVRLALAMPEEAHMHDWWVALLACVFGHAAFLRQPLVLYRQHAENVIGAAQRTGMERIGTWRHDSCRERWEVSVGQAEGLLRVYETALPEKARSRLRALLQTDAHPSRIHRLILLMRNEFFIHRFRSNVATAWFLWKKDAATPR